MADVMLRCAVPPHIGQSWGAIASEANPASAINGRWRFLDMRDDSGDNWQAGRLPHRTGQRPVLHRFDGVLDARRHAQAAARAPIVVDLVTRVRPRLDGPERTDLRTQRTANAGVVHRVVDQRPARRRRAPPVQHVGVVLLAEPRERGEHEVRCGLCRTARSVVPGAERKGDQSVEVVCLPGPLADPIEDLEHRAGIGGDARTAAARVLVDVYAARGGSIRRCSRRCRERRDFRTRPWPQPRRTDRRRWASRRTPQGCTRRTDRRPGRP